MRLGTGRALVGVLSVAAVVVPAAGIAYLGASSYREDRGIVATRLGEHSAAARAVADGVDRRLTEALDAAVALFARTGGAAPVPERLENLRARHPLARHPFRIAPDGRVRYAVRDPLRPLAADDGLGGQPFLSQAPRSCPERGFDACVREIRAVRKRQRLLAAARRRELAVCGDAAAGGCEPRARPLAEARRAYAALVGFDDSGPAALLGLARLDRLAGNSEAASAHYAQLRERFGPRRDPEGIGYALIADLGTAEVAGDPRALLAVYRGLAEDRYRAPPAALLAIADRVRASLADAGTAVDASELALLDARLTEARAYARFVADLGIEARNLLRTALDVPRGRAALHHAGRSLVFAREPDGGVVGLVLEQAMLESVAASQPLAIEAPAPTTRAIVVRAGAGTADRLRRLATAGFGPLLPHLSVALVNDRAEPDPLDEIIRTRGRRHLLLTGGLLAMLALGLLATVRGAARERELSRLKSDFVSTVSHELKTPLTSIRMFAEMLQEGVAGGDRDRESHYHSIIVRESERLGLLIANVLDYSQVERGTRRYELSAEPVVEVAKEAVSTFRRLRDAERYEVAFAAAPELDDTKVAIDRAVVVQSLLNLLSNAAKYGGVEAPIEVEVARRESGWVGISVRDHGPGIPRGEQARIFREFYRAPQAYRSGVEGTGLGLALVKRHLDEMGGRVALESSVGEGSVFTLIVPEVGA